jgi:hypothetical protein
MKITKITLGKEFKLGLPSFSNITASVYLEAEVKEGEKIDFDSIWDQVNQQLTLQVASTDPSWITTKEYKNFFKSIIKVPKGGEN